MGCSNAKASQPEAKLQEPAQEPAQEPVTTQEVPRAEEAKPPVADKPREGRLAHRLSPGDAVTVAKDGGIEGKVVQCTTTDVLVKTGDREQWFDMEDVQQWDTPPPLGREVVAGVTVTTAGGLSGTVVKRTTTEVCLRTEDGEKWCDIEDITVVRVMIVSATDLRNADWIGKSDPYVVCQIEGRPMTVKTPTVADNLEPVWNYEASLLGFQRGDALTFKIWDSDSMTKDDFLGVATLSSDQFLESGFYGQLSLADEEGRTAKGVVTVKAVVEPAPASAPKEDQTGPQLTEEMQKPTGWCC